MKYAAVVLAAGKGTRMNEGNGSDIPKVMYKLNGKPIIDYSVKLIKEAGVERVVLVVGYKKEMIEEYFDGEVEYAVQEKQLGTGHAAAMAKDLVKGKVDAVIVFYGDNPCYKPETIKKLIEIYEKEKPTVAMLTAISEDPTGYGRVFRDEKGDVVGIIEHKDCTPEELKNKEWNPGFYIFDDKWFWDNIENLDTDNAQHELYLTDMIVIAKEQKKRIIAMSVSEESEALGINTHEQLEKVEAVLQERFGTL